MNITVGTITRTVLLVLALINQLLAIKGLSPIPLENETIEGFISFAATAIFAITAWWKNNSFTTEAISADKVMADMKLRGR